MMDIKNTEYVEYNNSIRFVAIIGVLMIHVSAYGLTNETIGPMKWCVLTFFNCSGRIGVPFFVMIAGAIWLNLHKNVTLDKLLHKNIKKLLVAFFMWSWIYAISYLIGTRAEWDVSAIGLFAKRCVVGHYHMWYVQMMVVLYLVIPMLRQIIQKKELYKLILTFSFITGFVFPLIVRLPMLDWVSEIVDNMSICVFSPLIFYLLLGDYIRRTNWDKKRCFFLYVLAALASIARFYILIIQNLGCDISYLDVNGNDDFLLLVQSVGLYVFIKNFNSYFNNSKLITMVAKYSFFIYLSHDLVLQILFMFGINGSIFISLFMVPLIVLFVLVVCVLMANLLSKRKWFQKYYL